MAKQAPDEWVVPSELLRLRKKVSQMHDCLPHWFPFCLRCLTVAIVLHLIAIFGILAVTLCLIYLTPCPDEFQCQSANVQRLVV